MTLARARAARWAPALLAALLLAGCADSGTPDEAEDPSKLSAELEARAAEIEARAAAAAEAVEREAAQELAQLQAEARETPADDTTAAEATP